MENIIETRRMFIGPDEETEYYIATPTAENIRNADWQYSKTYTECLKEGIATSAEMADILRRRGIVGKEFDMRAKELSTNLNTLIAELRSATSNDRKTDLAYEVSLAREELFRWNQRLSGPMSNTCEQMSDDDRLQYLTSVLVQDNKGHKIWSTYDEYKLSDNQALTSKARYETMLFLQGYDSNFLENTPEAVAMKEIEDDIRVSALKTLAEQQATANAKEASEEAAKDVTPVVEESETVIPSKKTAKAKK